MLPLTPPDRSGSPYTSTSAFAGWRGLLAEPDAPVSDAEIAAFRAAHAYWIADWERFAGAGAVADQVRFEREWSALRSYAAERGVRLIGDIPLYVGPKSADHARHAELFQRGFVAGAPPDALSAVGQLWRNPLYDWTQMRKDGYRWWIERLRRASELADLNRIDHFRGLVAYWSVPARAHSARAGRWRRGPGAQLFDAARAELGELALIAEDLGVITEPVERLRLELGFPGMVVLQFGFGGGAANPHRPANHVEQQIVYTGTHDTDTAAAGGTASMPGAGGDRSRSRRSGVVAARARARLAGEPGDRAGPGRARARQRGAHEPARHRRGQLGLAARGGSAHARARAAAARRHRAQPPLRHQTGTVAPSALTESRGMWSLTFHSGAAASVAIGVFQLARVRSVIQSPALT